MKARPSLAGRGALSPGLAAIVCLLSLAAGLRCGWADTPQLISARNPAAASSPDYQNSVDPVVSADGRYVLFTSSANNLTPGHRGLLVTDVYLRDRSNQTTILISTNLYGPGGGNGFSGGGILSTNARYVLFESQAGDLVSGTANGFTNLFLRDVLSGTTTLINSATNGSHGNGGAWDEVMTPDGRYVAFVSSATNLVANDTNGISDIFVRDVLLGTTTLVSVGATGPINAGLNAMATPRITPDGRYLAFYSAARNLAGGMSVWPGDVYLRDQVAGSTVRVSTNLFPSGSASVHPTISDNGQFVSFRYNYSSARIYRFDSAIGTNFQIVANAYVPGTYADQAAFGPEMTPDGRFVVHLDQFNFFHSHIWDAQTLIDTNVDPNLAGITPGNYNSFAPAVTPDGRYVAFLCNATNLVTNVVNTNYHIYLRDFQVGTNLLIDVDTNGAGSGDMAGNVPSLTPDGRYVAFASRGGSLVPGNTNGGYDVFLRDATLGSTELISVRNTNLASQSGNGLSSVSQVSITPDGHWMVFVSASGNLALNDTNANLDVFLRDLVTGSNLLVSVDTNGLPPVGGYSTSPVMSSDGRFVAYVSAATNIVAGDGSIVNPANDIFLRDMVLGTTVRVNVDTNGNALGNGDSSAPVISQDGRYIAFLCKSNFQLANPGVYWRDTISNQTVMLTASSATNVGPSMSTDGRYVAYSSNFAQLYVWDAQTGSNIYVTNLSNFNPTGAALSPGGSKLMYSVPVVAPQQTRVVDLATKSNILGFARTPAVQSAGQWSVDDRYLVFVSSTNVAPGDANGTNDVYLCDTQTGTLTLVSMNAAHSGSGNGPSDSPVINGDGRFVVYRSFAPDIVPGATNAPNLFVFDRLTGSNTLLTVDQSHVGWSPWVARPAIGGNGSVVGFQSWRAGEVPGALDLNFTADVFAAPQTPWPTTDADGDGIPDAWTQQYFGHPLGQQNDLSRAGDDADGDGLSNLQEYLTGTNPKNSASALRLQISVAVSNNFVLLSWPSAPGKNFKVQYKVDLADANWLDAGGTAQVLGNTGYFTTALTAARYYRVVGVN